MEYEWHYLHRAINIFAFAIIPIMFSVHTIVSWDFAMAKQVGWRSSIFGPYFVIGAIFSGVSAVIAVLLVVRKTMHLKYFLRRSTSTHWRSWCLIFSIAWGYFFFNDYLVEWYGGEWVGHQLLTFQAHGALWRRSGTHAVLQHRRALVDPVERTGTPLADRAVPDRPERSRSACTWNAS